MGAADLVDLTCEIHEITTDTGRGSASDRFVPGTAHIVASNVHDVADMIFPRVPGPAYESELVPQPPIQNEEDLQAPDAGTAGVERLVVHRRLRAGRSPLDLPAGWDTYPWGPFKQMVGDYWEPERYADPDVPSYGYMGAGCAQWSRGLDWQHVTGAGDHGRRHLVAGRPLSRHPDRRVRAVRPDEHRRQIL